MEQLEDIKCYCCKKKATKWIFVGSQTYPLCKECFELAAAMKKEVAKKVVEFYGL